MSESVTIINRGTGLIEVHRTDCRDVKRDAEGASIWTVDVATLKDIALSIYDDEQLEQPITGWADVVGDVVMMPCTPALPYDETSAQPKASTGRYNAEYARQYRANRRLERLREEEMYPVLITMNA